MSQPDNVKEYKCPSCSSALKFDPASEMLHCSACGSFYDPLQLSGEHRHMESKAFDWQNFKDGLIREERTGNKVYNCRSCGATIEADPSLGATKCPYCGNNVVLDDKFTGDFMPNGIIPFKVMPGDIKSCFKGLPLLPNDFIEQIAVGKVKGVYVPFWLYDAGMDGGMYFRGTKILSYSSGYYMITETRHYALERDGSMAFCNIPVDGSKAMPDDLMDSLEPFDFSALVPYDGAYLAGFLANRFDVDPDESLPRANERLVNSARSALLSTCVGYGSVTVQSSGMQLRDPRVKYVLLPAYLVNYKYKGKEYRCAINGQTGKVVGDLPVSKAKSRAWFWGTAAGVCAVASAAAFIFLGGLG